MRKHLWRPEIRDPLEQYCQLCGVSLDAPEAKQECNPSVFHSRGEPMTTITATEIECRQAICEAELEYLFSALIFVPCCEAVLLKLGEVPAEPPTDIVSVEQARRDRNLTETSI